MPLMYPAPYLAVPYGLETQVVYNGLTMNANKRDYVAQLAAGGTYYIDEIAGLDDADLRSGAEARPDSNGEIPLQSYYGGRTVTITGRVFGVNMYQLRVLQQALREAFGATPNIEKPLVFSTGIVANDVYINCRKSAPLQMRENKQNPSRHTVRDFQISLRASDPRFLSVNAVSGSTSTNPANNSTWLITNLGNFSAYPTITVKGPFNAGLTLTNTTTGVFTKFDTALLSTNTMVLDTFNRTVKDSQNGNVLRYSFLDPSSSWLTFEPGSQNLQLSGVAGGTAASQVLFSFRYAYI